MTWPGVDRPDRLEQLARARVRRLPAPDDRRDPEVAEDRGQPVPGGDGDDAEGGCRDGRRRGGRLAGLGRRWRSARRWRVTVPGPADGFVARPEEPAVPSPASPPVNAAAFVSRTSRAWLSRFSMLIRLRAPLLSP